MHTKEQSDIHNFVLSEAQNISLLLRFPWELLLNPPPSLPALLPLCFFYFSSLPLFSVNVFSLTIWWALSNTRHCIISLGDVCIPSNIRTHILPVSCSVCCRLGNLNKSYIVTFFKQYYSNSFCLPVSRFLKSNKQMGLGWSVPIQVTLSPIDSHYF